MCSGAFMFLLGVFYRAAARWGRYRASARGGQERMQRTRTLEGGTRKGLYLGMRKYSASWSLYFVYFKRAARNLHHSIEVNVFV